MSHALRQRWAEGRAAVAQAAVATCRMANQLALAVLRRAKKAATAARIAAAMATDKKAMWHALELAGTEEGAARRLWRCCWIIDAKCLRLTPTYSPGCVAAMDRALVKLHGSAPDSIVVCSRRRRSPCPCSRRGRAPGEARLLHKALAAHRISQGPAWQPRTAGSQPVWRQRWRGWSASQNWKK